MSTNKDNLANDGSVVAEALTGAEIRVNQVPVGRNFDRTSFPKYVREFKELNLLGSGGFGDVYHCKNLDDEVFYAVKIIQHGNNSNEAKAKSEASIMSRLFHPNIIRFHQEWTEADVNGTKTTFICMELCHGQSLNDIKDMLENATVECIWEYFHQILEGLDYLHLNDVAHGDLSRYNILVGLDDKIKIIDFGGGCLLGSKSEHDKLQAKSNDVHFLGPILLHMLFPKHGLRERNDILKRCALMVNSNLVCIMSHQRKRILSISQFLEIPDEEGHKSLQKLRDAMEV